MHHYTHWDEKVSLKNTKVLSVKNHESFQYDILQAWSMSKT